MSELDGRSKSATSLEELDEIDRRAAAFLDQIAHKPRRETALRIRVRRQYERLKHAHDTLNHSWAALAAGLKTSGILISENQLRIIMKDLDTQTRTTQVRQAGHNRPIPDPSPLPSAGRRAFRDPEPSVKAAKTVEPAASTAAVPRVADAAGETDARRQKAPQRGKIQRTF